MKITSYNRAAGRRGKAKIHTPDEALSIAHQRAGLTGKRLPGIILNLYFDGRLYTVELGEFETRQLQERLIQV